MLTRISRRQLVPGNKMLGVCYRVWVPLFLLIQIKTFVFTHIALNSFWAWFCHKQNSVLCPPCQLHYLTLSAFSSVWSGSDRGRSCKTHSLASRPAIHGKRSKGICEKMLHIPRLSEQSAQSLADRSNTCSNPKREPGNMKAVSEKAAEVEITDSHACIPGPMNPSTHNGPWLTRTSNKTWT